MDKNSIVGKKMIVRANVAGVHAGVVTAFDAATQTVTLEKAYPPGLEIAEMTDEAYKSIREWKN